MNASQSLLKNQFPDVNGFQDVGLGNVMSFEVQTGRFIQILYANNHWVTVASDGVTPGVELFDSLYTAMVKAQIAGLLFTQHTIRRMDVQKQVQPYH